MAGELGGIERVIQQLIDVQLVDHSSRETTLGTAVQAEDDGGGFRASSCAKETHQLLTGAAGESLIHHDHPEAPTLELQNRSVQVLRYNRFGIVERLAERHGRLIREAGQQNAIHRPPYRPQHRPAVISLTIGRSTRPIPGLAG
jgi:hypothetical protein